MSNVVQKLLELTPEKRSILFDKIDGSASDYGLYPLSYAQERIWFMDRLAPDNANYNMPALLKLSGRLDIPALEKSLTEIVNRHESLRSAFVSIGSQPMQVVLAETNITINITDLSSKDINQAREIANDLILEEACRPFILEKGYLFRNQLFMLADNEYLLVLVLHHIISDDWSNGVMIRELSALYDSYVDGIGTNIPKLEIQYGDFSLWQREYLQGDHLEKLSHYWKRRLKKIPELLSLSIAKKRPAVQSFAGEKIYFSLDNKITEQLKALSIKSNATLFMVLLSAFYILLHRYSGQDDIVIGTPVANRNKKEIENLIGLFFNTLVLHVDLSGNPSFLEIIEQVKISSLDAYDHQDFPFVKLVEAIQPNRELSHTPIVQTMFILQNAPKYSLSLKGLKLDYEEIDNKTAQMDLIFSMWEECNVMKGYAHFNTELYESDDIALLLEHFNNIITQVVSQPHIELSNIALISQQEKIKYIDDWNNTYRSFDTSVGLYQLFENNVYKQPDKIAVVYGEESLTYSELNKDANRLAHYLRSLGVGPDLAVGIFVERSVSMLVSMIAVLKAGGAYIPLDPDYPADRISFMLSDGNVDVLITQQSLLNRIKSYPEHVVCIDKESINLLNYSDENPELNIHKDNLAYIIYTSGTTGIPKGVMIRHEGIVNNIIDINTKLNVGHEDKILALSSISFDMCVYETFGMLSAGGTIILPNKTEIRDPAKWTQLIRQNDVTVWNSAPALLEMLLVYLEKQSKCDAHTLRIAILGGDWAAVSLPDRLKQQARNVTLAVLGGATELSIHSTLNIVEDLNPESTSIPYGVPMSNQTAYVLDSNLQPLPPGIPGDLYLGGTGIARGYFNQPSLTAEKFIPNPFAKNTAERIYLTGDLARYRTDGVLELIGRIDHQVKIHGHRIELGEIESRLKNHTDINEAVVIAKVDNIGEKRLVAYLVFNSKSEFNSSEYSNYLKDKLPTYMIPKLFVQLECLPLSPNGKVDRKSLTDSYENEPTSTRTIFVEPSTYLEKMVASLFSEVTGVEKVGKYDDFFDLGGHSLRAMQLISSMRDVLTFEIPLSNIFEHTRVEDLCKVVEQYGAKNNIDVNKIAQLYNQVNLMADDDVDQLILEGNSSKI